MSIFKKDISKLNDEALMSRLQDHNDMSALTLLYERYSTRILGFLFKLFKGDEQKAQDYLQDVFLKVQEKKNQFDTSKKFYTWIFTIANNMAKTSFRETIATDIDQNSEPIIEWTTQDQIEKTEIKEFLQASVEKLDINHKTVILLRYNQGFSIKEISEVTAISEGTVKSRLFYATKKMSELYNNEFSLKL